MKNKKGEFITEPNAVKRLADYGISYPGNGLAKNDQEAVELAENLGFPVVMKIVSPDIIHKTDSGGVRLGLTSREDVKNAFKEIIASAKKNFPDALIEGVLICEQAKQGVEVIVGVTKDRVFGRVMMFGLGGIFTETLNDITFRSIPITTMDAKEMIEEIKGYPILRGVRNRASCDMQALKDLLIKVSKFIVEHPEIDELDLNPVCVYTKGVQVLDVRLIQ